MAITSIVRDLLSNYIVRVISSDNLATVAGAGYVTAQTPNITALNHGLWDWQIGDMVLVSAADGDAFFTLSSDFSTFVLYSTAGNGAVTLPVVSGDFTVFDGTLGALKDAGYSASNAAKTKVVMANGAVTSGNVASYVDTAGTIGDAGFAANKVLVSALTSPDIPADIVWDDVVVGEAALATGGSVTLQASSGSKQYKIRNIYLNKVGTNFSGGGGDRDLEITDGTTVYAVIPAATIQALVNAGWGSTNVPFPASASINTSSVAGTAIVAKYVNGTTDYSAGSLTLSVGLQRVA